MYCLTNENIIDMVSKIDALKEENLIEKDMLLKLKLAYEEILLNLQKHFSADKNINFTIDKRKNKIKIIISYAGENYNPRYQADEDIEKKEISDAILDHLLVGIHYTYEKNVNIITTTLNYKKMSLTKKLLIGASIGIAIGLLGSTLPIDIKHNMETVLYPISSILLGFIKMISFPIIFLSIITGITSCGSVSTFGKMGKTIITTFFKSMIFTEILTIGLILLFFKINILNTTYTSVLSTFINAIKEMFPNNIIKPFYDESCVQIVFLGMIIGCALLVLDKKVSGITNICDQLNELCKLILSWFSTLIPILVSILLIKFLWEKENLIACINVWKAVLVEFIVLIVLLMIQMLMIHHRSKLSYKDMIKAIIPAMIKGFTTGATYCAYQDIVDSSKNYLKVNESHVDFYTAMGMSFYKTSNVMFTSIVFYFAYVSHTEFSIIELIVSAILLILFSISVPSITGGGVAILTLLFEIIIGVESPYLGVASSVIIVLDFFTTAFRIGSMVLINKNIDLKMSKE